MSAPQPEPVSHAIVVPVDPETAFRLYVHRPGRTHPRNGQSGDPGQIVYEPFSGGRWFERDAAGREYDWGIVLAWQPPIRLALAWMVGATTGTWAFDPDPGHASHVEITFEPIDDGTRVRVQHTGFDRHGPTADRIRRGAATGWVDDLQDLVRAARGEPPVHDNLKWPGNPRSSSNTETKGRTCSRTDS